VLSSGGNRFGSRFCRLGDLHVRCLRRPIGV
jgi:hypothetical protein